MHRESRDRLYHRIIADIKFDRHLAIGLTNAQIYQLTERFCELVCNDAAMVVRADLPGFSHGVAGKFGKDEPWPDWADQRDLVREGLMSAPIEGASGSG